MRRLKGAERHSMEQDHHIISLKTYAKILGVLFFLTILTVGVATPVTGVDFGVLNTFMAMVIATVKATLVGMYFMHLRYDSKAYFLIFLSALVTLLVMAAFLYFDNITRELVESTLR